MHYIIKFDPRVHLCTPSGVVVTYTNASDAFKELGWFFIREKCGPSFQEPYWNGYHICIHQYSFVLKNELGDILLPEHFHTWVTKRKSSYFEKKYPWYCGVGPVPGTAKPRGRRSLYRRPKTLRILRSAQELDKVEPKAHTKDRKAPTLWDDLLRSDYQNRSWKRHRATQYRIK